MVKFVKENLSFILILSFILLVCSIFSWFVFVKEDYMAGIIVCFISGPIVASFANEERG